MVVRVLQGPTKGCRWIVGASTHGAWLGSYEFAKQGLFRELVAKGKIVYDVGANVGFYTLLGSVLTEETGEVYAFEPVPRNVEYLKRHISLNGLENVRVFEIALGASSGTVAFSMSRDPSMGHIGRGDGAEIEVRVEALDFVIAERNLRPPDLIKCDIEGAEAGFLRGALETLKRHRPTILLATHGRDVHAQCCEILQDLGYQLRSVDGRSLDETDEIVATVQQTTGACDVDEARKS